MGAASAAHAQSVVSPQRPVSLRVRGDDGEAITITTDLAAASRGMRRALLRQLLGLGAYQAASRSAMGQSIHRNDEAAGKEADASRYELDAAELSRTAATFDEAFDAHKDALAGHERADRELENADAAGVRATEKARESRAARERSQALTGQIHDANSRIAAINKELGGYEIAVGQQTAKEAAEVLADWEAASAALIGERERHDEAMAEYEHRAQSYAERRASCERWTTLNRRGQRSAARRKPGCRSPSSWRLRAIRSTHCPACGQRLSGRCDCAVDGDGRRPAAATRRRLTARLGSAANAGGGVGEDDRV